MNVAVFIAFTAAVASANHLGYPKGYLDQFGEPFSYGYGVRPQQYSQGLGYRGIVPFSPYYNQYESAILPENMYAFQVPQQVLKSYLPEQMYRDYVPASSRYIQNPFVPEYILKNYLPEELYRVYVPHYQVPTPVLKSYLPQPIFRNYVPHFDQIQKPFYQVPQPILKTYLPDEIYRSYIPISVQNELQGQQGVFETLIPATGTFDGRMTFRSGFGLFGQEGANLERKMMGQPLQHGVNKEFKFGLDTPIVQIPIVQ